MLYKLLPLSYAFLLLLTPCLTGQEIEVNVNTTGNGPLPNLAGDLRYASQKKIPAPILPEATTDAGRLAASFGLPAASYPVLENAARLYMQQVAFVNPTPDEIDAVMQGLYLEPDIRLELAPFVIQSAFEAITADYRSPSAIALNTHFSQYYLHHQFRKADYMAKQWWAYKQFQVMNEDICIPDFVATAPDEFNTDKILPPEEAVGTHANRIHPLGGKGEQPYVWTYLDGDFKVFLSNERPPTPMAQIIGVVPKLTADMFSPDEYSFELGDLATGVLKELTDPLFAGDDPAAFSELNESQMVMDRVVRNNILGNTSVVLSETVGPPFAGVLLKRSFIAYRRTETIKMNKELAERQAQRTIDDMRRQLKRDGLSEDVLNRRAKKLADQVDDVGKTLSKSGKKGLSKVLTKAKNPAAKIAGKVSAKIASQVSARVLSAVSGAITFGLGTVLPAILEIVFLVEENKATTALDRSLTLAYCEPLTEIDLREKMGFVGRSDGGLATREYRQSTRTAPTQEELNYRISVFTHLLKMLYLDPADNGKLFQPYYTIDALEFLASIDQNAPILTTGGGDKPVVLYEERDYGGRSVALTPGTYDSEQLDDLAGRISSIKMQPGFVLTVYTEDGQHSALVPSGRIMNVFTDVASLQDYGFEDRIVSVEIGFRTPGQSTNYNYPADEAAVTLYQHANYRGAHVGFMSGAHSGDKLILEDQVSSLRIKPGYRVTVYEHPDQGGARLDLYGNISNLADRGMNDRISSLMVTTDAGGSGAAATFYMDSNFGGQSLSLEEGFYDMDELQQFNDRISSIRTAPGYRVIVYVDPGARGQKEVLKGKAATLNGGVNDRISSLEIIRTSGTKEIATGSILTLRHGNGKVLEVANSGTDDRTNIQLGNARNTKAQQFKLTRAGKNTFYIESMLKAGMVVDVNQGSNREGTNVHLYRMNGSDAQKFVFRSVSNGEYEIRSALPGGPLLELSGDNVVITRKVRASGYWQSKPVGSDVSATVTAQATIRNGAMISLRIKQDGKALDLRNNEATNGNNVHIWNYNRSQAQTFYLQDAGGGYYYLASWKDRDMVLDVRSGSTSNRANLQVYRRNNSPAQKFRFVKSPQHPEYYTVESALRDNFVLDRSGGNVILYDKHGRDNQLWSIVSR